MAFIFVLTSINMFEFHLSVYITYLL